MALSPALMPKTAAIAESRAAVVNWLGDHGGLRVPVADLIEELGKRLITADVPIHRIACTLSDYHPEVVGRAYNWYRDKGQELIDQQYRPRISDAFMTSPIRVIRDGAAAVRRRLEGPETPDFPVLEELKALGTTDYVAFPIVFTDGSRQFIAFSTDKKGGFEADQLAYVEELLPFVGLRIEIEHSRLTTDQLLRTYLGANAARRVAAGTIRRVMGDEINAIIFACDMRGFTRLADTLPSQSVFTVLNAYYDAVALPVQRNGGDILKMIGDGILAIFPLDYEVSESVARDTASRAVTAVEEAISTLDELAQEQLPEGAWPLRAGFALHVGPVTFGNVGSRDRLDFTTIGPAVNEAFRLEALTKTLGYPALASETFHRLGGVESLRSVGRHALRGVREPKEVFTLLRH